MNTRIVIRIATMVVMAWAMVSNAGQAQTGDLGANGTNDLSIGERVWPSISNGIMFVDGKYISPPYVVSRHESDIFVNGNNIAWALQWPPKKKSAPLPPPEHEPVMPSSITEKTTNFDNDFLQYFSDKRRFVFSKFGPNKGIDVMVDVFKELPCVSSAKKDPNSGNTIIVEWKNGEVMNINMIPHERKGVNLTREQAEAFIDKTAEIFVRGLSNGDYYMLEGGGPSRSGLWGGAKQIFLPLADAMRVARDEADFLSIMKTNQPPGGMSEKTFRSFYQHKGELPKWEPRLRDATGKK